jgi:hypothetical protein
MDQVHRDFGGEHCTRPGYPGLVTTDLRAMYLLMSRIAAGVATCPTPVPRSGGTGKIPICAEVCNSGTTQLASTGKNKLNIVFQPLLLIFLFSILLNLHFL